MSVFLRFFADAAPTPFPQEVNVALAFVLLVERFAPAFIAAARAALINFAANWAHRTQKQKRACEGAGVSISSRVMRMQQIGQWTQTRDGGGQRTPTRGGVAGTRTRDDRATEIMARQYIAPKWLRIVISPFGDISDALA